MKASMLKTERQIDMRKDRIHGVQTYGEGNDYPQRVVEIVSNSVTGRACVETYAKFIGGRGFASPALYDAKANGRGETIDDILGHISKDYATFGGFALHLNFNALYEVSEVTAIPFEWVRFCTLDDDYGFTHVAVHPDWGRRYENLKRFSSKDIERYPLYDPSPETIDAQVADAGGWDSYKGQIFVFSNKGDRAYPEPIYCAALTDMSNEEGLSNITQRNVRHNFLPAGMLVDYDNEAESMGQMAGTKSDLIDFQGDMNAGQLMYVNVQNGETAPEFKPFVANNYDRAFTNAEEKTPQIIGRAFSQPPILRAEDVGSNFGATAMENAYEFYNTITSTERMLVERVFRKIFTHWHEPMADSDFTILPLIYRVNKSLAERLGENTREVISLITDNSKSRASVRAILSVIYGLDEEEINILLE